ncbi:hypothetical protein GPJ56_009825 [Histomonas meleagridis]|uniref:uncharacterized protein n=1 Tax=Histomonas meleagridis TaxID=135588 RepID=UPI00355A5E8F|nr:hypothetical protein GPJ56_009825 [Histomonas meleagridis]KAH0802868.1 hypothetical protein GO595_004375 [Histomonas meleagridis]
MSRKVNHQTQQYQRTNRLNQKEIDSSCYRLSRASPKYSTSIKSNQNESFAETYYSNNQVDTRPPEEKLEEINDKLQDKDLDDDEKFILLVQKRSLCQMAYGDNSAEAIRAGTELGAFYNESGKPESGLRNLNKAHQSAKITKDELTDEDKFKLAVEIAHSNIYAKAQNKQEKSKGIHSADSILSPYSETESEDKVLSYRRYLYLAKIKYYKRKYTESVDFYEKALNGYQPPPKKKNKKHDDNEEEEKEEEKKSSDEPDLYVEAAMAAEKAGDEDKAHEFYKKAYDLYIDLEYEEKAEAIKDKAVREEEEEEEKHSSSSSSDNEEKQMEEEEEKNDEEYNNEGEKRIKFQLQVNEQDQETEKEKSDENEKSDSSSSSSDNENKEDNEQQQLETE